LALLLTISEINPEHTFLANLESKNIKPSVIIQITWRESLPKRKRVVGVEYDSIGCVTFV